MSLNFKARKLVQRGTRSAQPAATAVAEGTLYFVTDELVWDRSTGSAWQNTTHEVGTWTPGIGGNGGQSGQTYSLQQGRYIRIGRLVTCWGRVTLSNKGTITSFVEITGFPFTSSAVTNIYGAGLVPYYASLTTAVVHMGIAVNVGSTRAALYATTAAATSAGTLAQADLSNTSDFIFSVTYLLD
jgi:hypothetical protein